MTEDVLLRFLGRDLIDVGGDDAKLEKLQAAVGDLAELLKKSPAKATGYSLVAFDPDAPVDDPVVLEALEALKGRWATYSNTFSGIPITVVRAMLLDALARAAADDERIGVVFSASARNALPFIEVGDELTIWSDVVIDVEKRVDARAEIEWATPASIVVPALAFDTPTIAAPAVKVTKAGRDFIKNGMMSAAGPQYQDPTKGAAPTTNGNPHWPQSNQHWVTEFGTRASTTIADVIDAVTSKIEIEQADLSEPFRALTSSITGYVDSTLKAVSAATAGLQRRTNLLWWKEALFSPSGHLSYRDLPPAVAAGLMAFDLYLQVPTFSPASVSAFLFETVTGLPSIESEKTSAIRDLVGEMQVHESLAGLRNKAAELVGSPEGRGPILALIAYPDVSAARAESEFRRLTGVPADTQLSLPHWAVWLFRELQAARATVDDAKPARRARKA